MTNAENVAVHYLEETEYRTSLVDLLDRCGVEPGMTAIFVYGTLAATQVHRESKSGMLLDFVFGAKLAELLENKPANTDQRFPLGTLPPLSDLMFRGTE